MPEFEGYTQVEAAVDSGAAASVIPETCWGFNQEPRGSQTAYWGHPGILLVYC